MGEADNPGPSRRRRTQRLRALPWVWDSDSEFEDDPRRVDLCEASHLEPQDSDDQVVMAPGPTQVDSEGELASQLDQSSEAVVAVQADSGARHHGRVTQIEEIATRLHGTPVVACGQSEVLASRRAISQSEGCIGPRFTGRHPKVHSRLVCPL